MPTPHSQTLRQMRSIDCARVAILVVEDNDASRRLVMETLRAAGFDNLSFARDAEEAIEQMQGHNPDLLLLDWGLPGMQGIDLVREIRGAAVMPDPRFANPHVPIVMLTARQRARDVNAARNAGISEFVIKPFSTASLLRSITSALCRKRKFVSEAAFTGPDRRRRKADSYPGLLRRNADVEDAAVEQTREMFRETLTVELNALRALMRARGGLDRGTLNHMVGRMMETEKRAHAFRLSLISQATQSLNDYMRLFEDEADPEVLDVHLEALIQLNEAPYHQRGQAVSIVKHLDTLVAKRRLHRKFPV